MVEAVDAAVRIRAFAVLADLKQIHGDSPIPRAALEKGFEFDGVRVPFLGPQGIFKPAILPDVPLSITTVPPVPNRPRPYDDNFGETGVLSYRYRGNDPRHRDNAGLRLAMERQTPLIYFHGIVPGLYEPAWPVYVVGDDPTQLTFSVMVDDEVVPMTSFQFHDPAAVDAKRRYITAVVQRRLHQKGFRERVLQAYQRCCAVCHLKHAELLEAAHILPDGHPQGEPTVRNGLALCKLHHAAFDSYMLGITPDLTIDIRQDLLEEIDGPMLVHGLQGFQGRGIRTPHNPQLKPHRDFLAERYDIFRRAG